jgi:hypothetical protein
MAHAKTADVQLMKSVKSAVANGLSSHVETTGRLGVEYDNVANVGGIPHCACIGSNHTRYFRRSGARDSDRSTGNGALVLFPFLDRVCGWCNSVAVATS